MGNLAAKILHVGKEYEGCRAPEYGVRGKTAHDSYSSRVIGSCQLCPSSVAATAIQVLPSSGLSGTQIPVPE